MITKSNIFIIQLWLQVSILTFLYLDILGFPNIRQLVCSHISLLIHWISSRQGTKDVHSFSTWLFCKQVGKISFLALSMRSSSCKGSWSDMVRCWFAYFGMGPGCFSYQNLPMVYIEYILRWLWVMIWKLQSLFPHLFNLLSLS